LRRPDAKQWKDNARQEFEAWAEEYDKSILNHLLFYRCCLKLLELITRDGRGNPRPVDVLDVGCGTGTFASMAARCDFSGRVVGLDMALNMCDLARKKAQHVGLDHKLDFVAADAEHLPFCNGSFDFVTCSNSFHHYPHQHSMLDEVYRVLRPGGKVIIVDGFRDNMIGWFVFDVCVASVEKSVHHCSAQQMRTLLRRSGFDGVIQEKFGFWVPVLATMGTKPSCEASDDETER